MIPNALPAIGDTITTREQFAALPLGAVLTDRDGWVHTKIAEPATEEEMSSGQSRLTTSYVDDHGGLGKFYACWDFSPTITSLPGVDSNTVETPTRPLVHFDDEKAGRDRSKAREAAAVAISKVNKGKDTNKILQAASVGESVDAYALNEAILDAMRSATTRAGQSPLRRAHARHIAHLGHIVQAVLENHADNLPAYGEGERSRYVAEAKAAVAEAHAEIERFSAKVGEMQQERSTLTQAASDERRRLCAEIDEAAAQRERMAEEASALREDIDARDQRINSLIREKTSLEIENEELQAALDYAWTFLSEENKSRVAGYRDGYQERANHDA